MSGERPRFSHFSTGGFDPAMAGNQVPVGLGPATDLWVQLMFRRGVNLDELAEDQDPRAFPSEGARKRAIKIDRWSGRHRVLVTAVTAVLAAVAAYFAWDRTADESVGWPAVYELLFVTAFTVGCWRVSTKARTRYHRR
jgi:hypothetical protein